MAKVGIHFKDFVDLLEDCEHPWHLEGVDAGDGELVLTLFIDGNPSNYELSIREKLVEVTKEMTL